MVIIEAPRQIIASIFSQNFMRCFMNHLALTDRYLHRASEKTQKAIIKKVKNDPSTTMSILAALLALPQGDINFDARTKTKTIETGLAHAAILYPHEVVELYQNMMLRPATQDDKVATLRRKLLTDQLVNALHSYPRTLPKRKDSFAYIQQTLSLLAKFAYCNLNSLPTEAAYCPIPTISPSSRSMFRTRISSCLAHVLKFFDIGFNFTYRLLRDMHERNQANNWGGLLLDTDLNVQRLMDKTLATLYYMENEIGAQMVAKHELRQSVSILLSMSMLQVHNGDVSAVSDLEDLNKMLHEKSLAQLDIIDVQDSTTLVEIILSLISKPSLLFRRLSQQVFAALAGAIDRHGLMSLLKVIDEYCFLNGILMN